MTDHEKLVELINNYLKEHNFTKEEFCRLSDLSPAILDKILNKQHYVSLHDYKKLAFILNVDLISVITY